MKNSPDLATLEIVQQVLRGVVVALIAEHKGDMALTASVLQAFASESKVDPMAKTILLDLATGLDTLGSAFGHKQ
jgi:hypothetical protein